LFHHVVGINVLVADEIGGTPEEEGLLACIFCQVTGDERCVDLSLMNSVSFFVELASSVESFGVRGCEEDGAFGDKAHISVFEVIDRPLAHHVLILLLL